MKIAKASTASVHSDAENHGRDRRCFVGTRVPVESFVRSFEGG